MSVKALGIALKLTFSGMNQLLYPQTWVFTTIVLTCVITQMNYLNKVIQILGDFINLLKFTCLGIVDFFCEICASFPIPDVVVLGWPFGSIIF